MSFSDDDDLMCDVSFKNEGGGEQADNLSELSDDVMPRFMEMTETCRN